jgi:transcriptional regulator with XRE-family HTH domain
MPPATVECPPMLRLNVARMKQLREDAGMTQAQAAAKAKMSTSRWNDIEAGGRSNVTIETLGMISAALSCEPADLLVNATKMKS